MILFAEYRKSRNALLASVWSALSDRDRANRKPRSLQLVKGHHNCIKNEIEMNPAAD